MQLGDHVFEEHRPAVELDHARGRVCQGRGEHEPGEHGGDTRHAVRGHQLRTELDYQRRIQHIQRGKQRALRIRLRAERGTQDEKGGERGEPERGGR